MEIDLFGLLGIGIGAFVASNIDDTFILIFLFSTVSFQARHVFLGQFLGIATLIMVSALGSLISLVVPPLVIGLLGLVPIVIGIKRLVELRWGDETDQEKVPIRKKSYMSSLAVAGRTVSNGGDDIGVFTPLFAKYNTLSEVTVLVTILMALTFVWCTITYYLVNHPIIANRIKHLANILTPFVLIGLGVYILADSFT
jgi:cadmium resistance protein CadD (predicted permease)